MRSAPALLLLCLTATALAEPGCGKKGPPLAPLARVPQRVMDVAARRTGEAVTLMFTIPSSNIDETKPADIGRVDVYAVTAMAPADVRDPRRMTLVASVAVRKPPEPEEEKKPSKKEQAKEKERKPAPPPPLEPGEDIPQAMAVINASSCGFMSGSLFRGAAFRLRGSRLAK